MARTLDDIDADLAASVASRRDAQREVRQLIAIIVGETGRIRELLDERIATAVAERIVRPRQSRWPARR